MQKNPLKKFLDLDRDPWNLDPYENPINCPFGHFQRYHPNQSLTFLFNLLTSKLGQIHAIKSKKNLHISKTNQCENKFMFMFPHLEIS